jgi:hypothetical protein
MRARDVTTVLQAIGPAVRAALAAALEPHRLQLATLHDRLTTVERKAALELLTAELATVRERLAVLETRAPVPGPPGAAGRDGVDGLGFDDLAVAYDGERTLALRFERGGQTKTFPIALPFLKFQDVYQAGRAYVVGDLVLWQGHLWHCKAATVTRPGESATHWQLCIRRGRDGRDARGGA